MQRPKTNGRSAVSVGRQVGGVADNEAGIVAVPNPQHEVLSRAPNENDLVVLPSAVVELYRSFHGTVLSRRKSIALRIAATWRGSRISSNMRRTPDLSPS